MLIGALTGCDSSGTPADTTLDQAARIQILSNRADLVSGGDALVEIVGVGDEYTAAVDGRDVTAAFALRPNGRVIGLIQGLQPGANILGVRARGLESRITITNHPIGGPIFAGEQIEPWLCTTEANGLGAATDEQCNAPTVYTLVYRPEGETTFRHYDPSNPPHDVAMTTTDEGQTVPYIIREETGTSDRGIYRIAVLFDPARGWEPWAPQQGWNRKLLYRFGAGCSGQHEQGTAPDVRKEQALSRGFMVASSSLNALGSTCNLWTSAEAVMMLKERIVEAYGEIRYTLAEGGSGGAIGQHVVANAYPGLLQGIQPAYSYEDYWSTAVEVVDCHILLNYFRNTAELWPHEHEQIAVTGHASLGACTLWADYVYGLWMNPERACGSGGRDYRALDNPRSCRGTVQDFNVAVLGRRRPELWDDTPSAATRDAETMAAGFALQPYDNAGVQYGLQALLDGGITAEQFVDLNEKIGTVDIDGHRIAGRRRGDTGSEVLYRSGGINDGQHLGQVAIIDLRPSSNFEIHTDFHSYAMRARLDRTQGRHDNQVIRTSALGEYATLAESAFLMLDRWLAAVEADTGNDPLDLKIVRNKPSDVVDDCLIEGRTVTDRERCATAYPYYGSPRLVAGMPLTDDILGCQLKLLNRADLPQVRFSDTQWARLQAVFPDGVCDYSKAALGQQSSIPWMTYRDGPGGQPLPKAPASTAG